MEDKELQQLFEAKRTVEANRRRQAALEAMIAAHSGEGHKRRLWPVWAGAAAAGVALLLLSLPAMYNDSVDPVGVAQVEVPEPTTLTESTPEAAPAPLTRRKAVKRAEPAGSPAEKETIEATETADHIEPAETTETSETTEPIRPVEAAPAVPRVHRRSSTMLACTEGCTITIVPDSPQTASTDIQQLLANALGSRNNNPLILKTFELQ